MMDKGVSKQALFYRYILFAIVLAYYLWLVAQIPYTHDDWAWGTKIGLNWLQNASINSRYAGNTIEVILTRSSFMKIMIMGITFALIPVIAVELVKRLSDKKDAPEKNINRYIYLFFLANALTLVIPVGTWMQTFGWVAGFSNYVTVSLAMLTYLLIIVDLESGKEYKPLSSLFLFLFGVVMQLFVENVTVCTMMLTTVCCIHDIAKKRRVRFEYLFLLAGNLIGTVLMFSSPIYTALLETGTAVDGVRKLEINREVSILSEIIRLSKFFLFYYPDQIWSSNLWMCCYICIIMSIFWLKKKKLNIQMGWVIVNVGFLIYLLYIKFCGKIQFSSYWWTGAFSSGMSLLFFLCVMIQCILLFDERETTTKFLLFAWIAAPTVMLPLVIVVTGGGRCCLPTQMLQMLFCIVLTVKLWDCCKEGTIRTAGIIFLILSSYLWVGMGKIYFDIGSVKRIRDHDVFLAQTGTVNSIQMKAFPHGEYLWNPDPEPGSYGEVYFREFYQIPDEVELWFDAWWPKSS